MAVSFRADSACRLVSYFKALIELVYQKLRLPNQREVPDTENAAEPAVTASQRTLACWLPWVLQVDGFER